MLRVEYSTKWKQKQTNKKHTNFSIIFRSTIFEKTGWFHFWFWFHLSVFSCLVGCLFVCFPFSRGKEKVEGFYENDESLRNTKIQGNYFSVNSNSDNTFNDNYKTIASQSAPSGTHVKNFLFFRKVMFPSWDIRFFVFLTITWTSKFVTSWWVLAHERVHF